MTDNRPDNKKTTKREPLYFTYFTQEDRTDFAFLKLMEGFSSEEDFIDHYGGYDEWPASMREKYKSFVREQQEEVGAITATGKKIQCDDVTLYLDCDDGNHYFSTRYFNNGSIEKAALRSDSRVDFDHIDTAVYAFVNDWKDWNKEFGAAQKTQDKLLALEALRADTSPSTSRQSDSESCQHEDLGSLGYTHGSTVKCPNCGKLAEVW
jgi:hypothetical protein